MQMESESSGDGVRLGSPSTLPLEQGVESLGMGGLIHGGKAGATTAMKPSSFCSTSRGMVHTDRNNSKHDGDVHAGLGLGLNTTTNPAKQKPNVGDGNGQSNTGSLTVNGEGSTTANGGNENEKTPSDPEARTPTPLTPKQKRVARVQFVTLCWTLFLAGWNDGSTGPLLPRIQEVYKVNFTIVSLIFVFACVGFLSGAIGNINLTDRIGFGKAIVFGSLCQVVAYSIQSSAPPFPVFVMAYTINGIGLALEDAQANGFVATLKDNPESKMGVLHAAYGLGAFASPLAATQFAQLHRWSFHFLVSLGVALVNTIALIVVFKLRRQNDCLEEAGEIIREKSKEEDGQSTGKGTFKTVMTTRVVHLLAIFILVYVGVEVTIGGWIVTFIIDVRGGGPSAGYISSGFFGGLTVGRIALLWVNKKVGERNVMFIYTVLCIALEFVIWFVPSLIGDAVAVSFVGFFLGPMYPIVMNQTSRILPRWILTGSIGWIAGFGQAGSALFPFVTGAIAERHGIKSLQPLLVAMMVFMMFLWGLVPRAPARPE